LVFCVDEGSLGLFRSFLESNTTLNNLKNFFSFEFSFQCFEWNLNFSEYDNYSILKELAIHHDIILGFFLSTTIQRADDINDFMKGFSRFLF